MSFFSNIGNFFKNTDWQTIGQKTTQASALSMNAGMMSKTWGMMTRDPRMSMCGSIFPGCYGYNSMSYNPYYSMMGMGYNNYNLSLYNNSQYYYNDGLGGSDFSMTSDSIAQTFSDRLSVYKAKTEENTAKTDKTDKADKTDKTDETA